MRSSDIGNLIALCSTAERYCICKRILLRKRLKQQTAEHQRAGAEYRASRLTSVVQLCEPLDGADIDPDTPEQLATNLPLVRGFT